LIVLEGDWRRGFEGLEGGVTKPIVVQGRGGLDGENCFEGDLYGVSCGVVRKGVLGGLRIQ
jgi:hypothetical protein